MTHDEWDALRQEMAVETVCMGAADQMIPREEMLPRIEHWKAAQDQRWMNEAWQMGAALIALEKLGYTVEKR